MWCEKNWRTNTSGYKETDLPTNRLCTLPSFPWLHISCSFCVLFTNFGWIRIEIRGRLKGVGKNKKKLRWKNSHNKIISKIPPNFCLIRSNLRSNRIIIDMKIVLKANVLLRCYEHLSLWNHQQCFLFTKICIKDQIGWSVGWLHYRPRK